MNITSDFEGPFGGRFSILWIAKKALIDSGREDEVTKFLAEANNVGDRDDLKMLVSKYVDIDWSYLSME